MRGYSIAGLALLLCAIQLMSCGGPEATDTVSSRTADSLARVRQADSLAALATAPFSGVWLIRGEGTRGEVQLEAAGDRGLNGAFIYEEVDANLEMQSSTGLISVIGRVDGDTLRADLFDPQGRLSSQAVFTVEGDSLRFTRTGAEINYPATFVATKE